MRVLLENTCLACYVGPGLAKARTAWAWKAPNTGPQRPPTLLLGKNSNDRLGWRAKLWFRPLSGSTGTVKEPGVTRPEAERGSRGRTAGPLGQRPPSGAGPFGREAQLGEPPRLQRGTGKWGSRARIPKTTAEPTACTTPWGRAAASSTGTPPGQGLGSPERRPAQGRPPGRDPRNSPGTAPPPRARVGPPLVPRPRSRARRTDLRVPGRRVCPGPRPRPQPSALRMSGWRGWNQIQPAER